MPDIPLLLCRIEYDFMEIKVMCNCSGIIIREHFESYIYLLCATEHRLQDSQYFVLYEKELRNCHTGKNTGPFEFGVLLQLHTGSGNSEEGLRNP